MLNAITTVSEHDQGIVNPPYIESAILVFKTATGSYWNFLQPEENLIMLARSQQLSCTRQGAYKVLKVFLRFNVGPANRILWSILGTLELHGESGRVIFKIL